MKCRSIPGIYLVYTFQMKLCAPPGFRIAIENFGRPQPRIGGLPEVPVAKTESMRRQSRSETSRRAAETKRARKRAVDQI
jgi:hypothetical protein